MFFAEMNDDLVINPEHVESIEVDGRTVVITMTSTMRHYISDSTVKEVMYKVLGRNTDGSLGIKS